MFNRSISAIVVGSENGIPLIILSTAKVLFHFSLRGHSFDYCYFVNEQHCWLQFGAKIGKSYFCIFPWVNRPQWKILG